MARTAATSRVIASPPGPRAVAALWTSGTLPNGQTFNQFWNAHARSQDLGQAVYNSRSNLAGITVGQTSIICGIPMTPAQITIAIAACLPGGATTNGCQYLTWADETTQVPSQITGGYIDELGPHTIITDNPLTSGATTVNVSSNASFAGFSTTYYAQLDDGVNVECVAVTAVGGTGNKQWTITRAQGGTTAHQFAQGTTIRGVAILNGAINGSATTLSINANYAFAPTAFGSPSRFSLMLDSGASSEVVYTSEANAGSLPGPITVVRATPSFSHADATMARLVWPSPGIVSVTAQANASGVHVMFSPNGGSQLASNMPAHPEICSNSDAFLYEAQQLQSDLTFVSEVTNAISQIRFANTNRPVLCQLNVYEAKDNTNPAYNANEVIRTTDKIVAACNPDIISMEFAGGSQQQFIDWMTHYRP